jgi:uncharacterized protein (TIGR04255 family)
MVEPADPSKRPLSLPPASRARFATNFIRLAVCELRFPTLLELETHAPVAFQKAIRRDYPVYEDRREVRLNASGPDQPNRAHTFYSKNRRWTVAVRQASLALETSQYETFDKMKERVENLLPAAEKLADSAFFTRIGLRYINVLPVDANGVDGWVNDELVGPLARGTFGTVGEYSQHIRGATRLGGFLFRHGMGLDATEGRSKYVLDLDFYREDVEPNEVLSTLRGLHDDLFALFSWSLGDKARAHLGPSTLG